METIAEIHSEIFSAGILKLARHFSGCIESPQAMPTATPDEQFSVRILPVGEQGLTVEFGNAIAPEINARVLVFLGLAKLNKRFSLAPRLTGRRDVRSGEQGL